MKILITAPFHESGIDKLEKHCEVAYENWRDTGKFEFSPGALIDRLNTGKVDILVTEADEVDSEVIEKTQLKLIASCRGTPVNVDAEAAASRKIPIIYAPHRNADAVADLTVTLMLMATRKILQADRLLRSGFFDASELDEEGLAGFFNRFQGAEMSGLTVGIIGFGAIGSGVARRLHLGFGSRILYYDPYVPKDNRDIRLTKAKSVSLEELFRTSDLVTIHTPPIAETEGLVGEKEFAMMKPTAYFFNLARSYCIDENALYEAVRNKQIAGAGLDVFDREPVDSDNRFLPIDDVIVTPHIGGNTIDVVRHQSDMICTDIMNFIEGRPLRNQWTK